MIEWHPTAENILVSAGYEHIIILWDISRGTQVSTVIEEGTVLAYSPLPPSPGVHARAKRSFASISSGESEGDSDSEIHAG